MICSKSENGKLTVLLSGKIDSTNAEAVGAEIDGILSENAHEEVVLDVESLEYISSAGLRVVLRLRKAEPALAIINAPAEVYEIFEMTGFTEMMPVSKAYRRLSVEGCEVIGRGANGEVYRLDADTIIKVYLNPDCLPDIHRERELARKAFVMGIPTAIPYDVVKVGDGYGSVFELLNAKSFAKILNDEPERADEIARLYVDLLKKIHATELKPGDMPDMKAVVLGWAEFLKDYLPADKAQKFYELVEAVPENHHMMHGDYHVKNVMMQNGEVLLIDMDTLCMGNPVFEFASIYLAYIGYGELDHTKVSNFIGIPWETAGRLWRDTLRLYFGTDDEEKLKAVENKARLIGYARMMRRSIRRKGLENEESRAEIEFCKKNICELLESIDSLAL